MTTRTDWVRVDGIHMLCGITRKACDEIGEIVWVELPEVGTSIKAGDLVAVVESTKAAFDIYASLPGKVVAINSVLKDSTAILNQDPEGAGWLYKLLPDNITG